MENSSELISTTQFLLFLLLLDSSSLLRLVLQKEGVTKNLLGSESLSLVENHHFSNEVLSSHWNFSEFVVEIDFPFQNVVHDFTVQLIEEGSPLIEHFI